MTAARVGSARRRERAHIQRSRAQVEALASMRQASREIVALGFITLATHSKLQSSTARLLGKAASR